MSVDHKLSIKTEQAPETVLVDFYELLDDDYSIKYDEAVNIFRGKGLLSASAWSTFYHPFNEIKTTVDISVSGGNADPDRMFLIAAMRWFSRHDEDAYCLLGDSTWMMQINGKLRIDIGFKPNMDYSDLTKPFEFAELPHI